MRVGSPFRSNWGRTLNLLGAELRRWHGAAATLAVDVAPGMIRQDGGLRADARIVNPAVVWSFTVGADRLDFGSDAYRHWQDNVHAVALSLEALRAVDRYGVAKGRQYVGFRSLPAGHPEPPAAAGAPRPTVAYWWAELRALANLPTERFGAVPETAEAVMDAVRRARSLCHPDRHEGSVRQFQRVEALRDALAGAGFR
jgi:hypothetical protein